MGEERLSPFILGQFPCNMMTPFFRGNMPSCRRRGGGREDESGLVVEGGEGDTREEMEEEIRPTGQMDTIRSSIKTSCKSPG